ncbi:MAG: copper oxidase [Cycloclasticus sp. symbiont of Poecilosclerida sp. M]|nr:MAG: copper oxidase [Cycloclasticus sp. symbiont of Poecilosclerida sp. M]
MKRFSVVGLVISVVTLSVIALFLYDPYLLYARFYEYTGMPGYQAAPPAQAKTDIGKVTICDEQYPEWRKAYTVGGIKIQASDACNPDNPYEVAAFVRGTNNVIMPVLMRTQLSDDAVIKTNDRDGDGDPDDIVIRVEVAELNGRSPDGLEFIPGFEIAPGIRPGAWVFAPKSRGMSTVNRQDLNANRLLRLPSAPIRVEAGDNVTLILENTHYFPHTIHLHGVDHSYSETDGVPQTSEKMTMPGEQHVYKIKPRHAGTMFYHCHVQVQVHMMMGLQGLFIVEENKPNNWVQTFNVGAGKVRYPSVGVKKEYAQEYDLHYQAIDTSLNNLIQTSNDPRQLAKKMNRLYDITDGTDDYFMLNGRSFPYTLRESLITVEPNQHTKMRVLNGTPEVIALHTHGHKATITAYDGVDVNPAAKITRDVYSVSPAQRIDLDLYTKDDGLHSYGDGVWLMHDHAERAITTDGIAPGGNVSQIVYRKYLNKNAMATLQGEDVSPYFSPEYYKGNLPSWSAADAFGFFDDVGGRSIETYKDVLLVIVLGMLIGVLFLLLNVLYSFLHETSVKLKKRGS